MQRSLTRAATTQATRLINVSDTATCRPEDADHILASHPVIFTKRSSSIIASGEEIYPHEKFTQTLDYEGEIGVIIGKAGFMIDESNAMDHVWGYTIINGESHRTRALRFATSDQSVLPFGLSLQKLHHQYTS
jgi:2-keto-4-pentenoate hydratase/2-oxohepta-3-ene-1,7-dioic acid hydratase in catechol pathway